MRRFVISPLVRISFSLSMLTVSILLITDLLGLMPDTRSAELQFRKVVTESLAVQISTEVADQQLHNIEAILRLVVERNDKVNSAAVRTDTSGLLAEFGNHDQYWTLQPNERSTATQVQVSIFNEQGHWGTVELSFTPLDDGGYLFSIRNSFLYLMLFMGSAGFLAYLFLLKRAMHELNPDEVIPDRVRQALDTLAEGLLIVDKDGYIVFANSEFARKVGLECKDLAGKDSARLGWKIESETPDSAEFPWHCVLAGEGVVNGVKIKLKTELDKSYIFSVNASPITGTGGKIRGALITFDNITETEHKNEELLRTLTKLEDSKKEITRQNKELRVLATHDPLTGVLNRRALFHGFDTLFAEARENDEELSCIMVDIDHFKSVNDNFGHTVGDQVIKLLSKVLSKHSRSNDLVGRYGGEEFCIVLPGANIKVGTTIAERIRLTIQEGEGADFNAALRITASFGVSSLSFGASSPQQLVEQADKAMYVAKENGRNRVIHWISGMMEGATGIGLTNTLDKHLLETAQETAKGQIGGIGGDGGELAQGLSVASVQDEDLDQGHPDQNCWQDIKLAADEAAGLPNSVVFFDRIDQGINRTQRDKTQIAVLIMDINTLQRVYDTLGLAVGDKFVKITLARLKQTLRLTDTVALTDQGEMLFAIQRLESNKIAVVLTDLEQPDIVTNILRRIFSVFEEPIEVEGNEFYLNVVIGVSMFPLDGEDPETLIRNASNAMREAKQSQGRNNFRFYADDINQRAKKQIKLEAELYQAIKRAELIVYYQPKVDLRTGSIQSMEALIRWQHPQLGIVPPDDFIPLAEHTGLIEEISRWVIRAVCRQISTWQEAGYGTFTVAVNLSPVEFRNPDLGDQIIAMVNESGIPTSAIELEITETAVIQDIETTVSILETLSNAGFKISVDDFGTGYSSLSYLKRFPLSKVKIDRSFISGFLNRADDAAIVSAIIAMSHSLGLKVVAEGVETEEELRFLQDLHCDEIQGYLISKPVPCAEVIDLLARSSSIRRMVMESHQGKSPASGMIGILNDFPAKDMIR